MPTFASYRLRFSGPVHLGRLGLGGEEVRESCPSDTLFSALLDTAADLGGPPAAESLVAPFLAGDPPWLISSAFPFAGEVAFYPRPQLRFQGAEDDPKLGKWLKHLRYLSEGTMRLALAGKSLAPALARADCRLPGALVTAEELPRLGKLPEHGAWHSEARPHVAVDRASQASALYSVGQTWFAPACGLHALMLCRDERQRPRFEELLTHLGHRGLGGERSRGLGGFQWVRGPQVGWTEAGPPSLHSGQALCLTLSRYHPSVAELEAGALQGDGVGYLLETVGGWMAARGGAAQRRRQITFLAEGSLFRAAALPPPGEVVEVTPEHGNPLGAPPHPVYRYGYALVIGVEATT